MSLLVIQNMEEDIQNYSPTVMFRGTPCMYCKDIYNLKSSDSFDSLFVIYKPSEIKDDI